MATAKSSVSWGKYPPSADPYPAGTFSYFPVFMKRIAADFVFISECFVRPVRYVPRHSSTVTWRLVFICLTLLAIFMREAERKKSQGVCESPLPEATHPL